MKKDQDDRVAEFYDYMWENYPYLVDRSFVNFPVFRKIVLEAIVFGYKLGKEDK